ncbi:hypothetical protein LUZ63_015618 [Rhynchospora breviuscula]|uniref:Late embryogenesis abundant protein LEA-2 subgroup domain-containing protein n=1 Tax=Rhynchospora breviuscula TaxID=2022672 RepID=A0A9Q0CCN6_9POAL|nr:hypothetical protein LUZ63_015618 [Rhynchospora breviuscula]
MLCDKDCCRRFGIFVIILVIVLFVCFIIAIFVSHVQQKIVIVNANLSRFEITTSPTTSLFFNLSFTMSIHNSLWYDVHGAKYQDMEIACYYNTMEFDSIDLGNFGLDLMKTRIVNHSRSGNVTMNLTSNEVDAFKRSSETGYFDIEIWLQGNRIFYNDYDGEQPTYLSYPCKLRLQLITSQNSTTQGNFTPVKCY